MDRDNQTITLKDGRKLGFSEHGDLNGKPVFFMHGNPSSRFLRYPDDTAKNLGLRIITPDRPGMGLSDFQPNRKPLDLPDDIVQLADHLKIGKFSIFGGSAGGCYTAACAYKIPERLEKVILLSSGAPFNYAPDPLQGMDENLKKPFILASKMPWLVKLVLWGLKRKTEKDPEKAYQDFIIARCVNEYDRKIANDPVLKSWVIAHSGESMRKGTRGVAHELKIAVNPAGWGFNLADIKIHVDIWAWEEDHLTPIAMSKYLASVIPNNTTHFFPGGGHLSSFGGWKDVLASIAGK
jgi:pimeloyl-ACP methyl ester carboxylesterase